MKLLSTFVHERDFDINYQVFFDYAPTDVEETLIFDEADALFMLSHNKRFDINVSKEQLEANGYDVPDELDKLLSLNNYPAYLKPLVDDISDKIWDLPRLVYMSRFGNPVTNRTTWDLDGSVPKDLRDIDIPIASWDISGLHVNGQYAPTIDNRIFYKTRSTSSRKGTVTMQCDNIGRGDVSEAVMKALIDCEFVTRINILLADGFIKETYGDIDKVNCLERVGFPLAMKSLLSDSEWTLQIDQKTGMERTGIEGGMCGAHPIYIGTEFYRNHFGNDLGVAYVDPDNMIDSLLGILETGSDWDNHIDNFTKRMGSEYHIPKFWDNVKSIVMKD